MPKLQVKKFQLIAPKSAEISTISVTTLVSTSPFEIVAATAVPKKAPKKLKMLLDLWLDQELKILSQLVLQQHSLHHENHL